MRPEGCSRGAAGDTLPVKTAVFAPPAPPRRPLPWALGLIALALPPLPILAQIPAPAEIPTETEEPPSQLRAGDWAYQALAERLAEPGCPPGADALLRGGQPIERFEAAALLQACLGAVGAATDRDRRLLEGFAAELALLRGRSDGLEARLGELEATRFAPTTKLGALATFVVGGNRYGSGRSALRDSANASGGATSFSVDLQLAFDTSFGGQDQLRVLLRSGNFGDSPFGGDGPGGPLSTLEIAFQEDCGTGVDCGEVLAVEKLFLRWPLGAGLTAVVGGHVGQEDMLPLWPSVYPADTVLNVFTLNGAPLAYSTNLGPGAGLWWQEGGLSLAANAVAANGDSGDPASGGLGSAGSAATASVQLGFTQPAWAVAAIWTRLQAGVDVPGATPFLTTTLADNPDVTTDAWGLGGFWQPRSSGWLPSLSAGWGWNQSRYDRPQPSGALRTSQSWLVGLQWTDTPLTGSVLGMAVGQPGFATRRQGGVAADDGGLILEGWLRLPLSDAITVTPSVFWLGRPLGQESPSGGLSQLGMLLRTAFSF